MQLHLYVRSILTTIFSLLALGVLSLIISSCDDDDDSAAPPVETLIRFTLVDPEGDSLVISNFGTTEIDISDYQLCLGPNQYNAISNYTDITGDLSLSANETVTIKLGSGTQNVTSLLAESGGLGLFASAEDFTSDDPELLLDYVQWGAADQNRVTQAVTAERWDNASTFIDGFAPFTFTGNADDIGASFWDTTDPEDVQLTTGFLISATTPNDNTLVRYFSELPTGTVDMSGGQTLSTFIAGDVAEGFIYGGATDRTNAFMKLRVNGNGELVEEGRITTIGSNPRTISVIDETTGVYVDTGDRDELKVFNPETFELDGAINMDPLGESDEEFSRQLLITRDDEVFSTAKSATSDLIIQSANFSTGQFSGSTSIPIPTATLTGLLQQNRFVDETGTIYIMQAGNPILATLASIHRIPAGSGEVDPDYTFRHTLAVNPTNVLAGFSSNFTYIGSNRAIAFLITDVPPQVLALVESVGGDPRDLSPQQQQLALALFASEDTGNWVELNLVDQSATRITGLPGQSGFATPFITFSGGQYYMTVFNATENSVYRYNPDTSVAEKVFDITGGEIFQITDLSAE